MRGQGVMLKEGGKFLVVGRGQGVTLKEGGKFLVVGRKIQGVLRAVV